MALNSSIPAQHQTNRKKQCEIIRRFLLVAVVMSQGRSPRSTVNGSRWQDSASAHQSCHPARAKGEIIRIIRSSSITIGRGYHNASFAAIFSPHDPPRDCWDSQYHLYTLAKKQFSITRHRAFSWKFGVLAINAPFHRTVYYFERLLNPKSTN
jgi:hypothetical protein